MRKRNARARILETAGRLFTERGYAVVGINEIIEKSETAKATFYQHFPSKERLCAAWLDHLHQSSEERHRLILDSRKSVKRILEDYFEDLKDWLTQREFRGCPFSNTTAMIDSEAELIRSGVVTHKQYQREFFIELAHRAGAGRKAEQVGSAWFLLYSGAAAEAQNLRETWPVDVALKASLELVKEA